MVDQVVGDIAVLVPVLGATREFNRAGAKPLEHVAVDVRGEVQLGKDHVFIEGREGVVDRRLARVARAEQVERLAAAVLGRQGDIPRRVGRAGVGVDRARDVHAADDLARAVLFRIQGVFQERADHVVEEAFLGHRVAEFPMGVPAPASAKVALQPASDPPGVVVGAVLGLDAVQRIAAEFGDAGAEGVHIASLRRRQEGVGGGDFVHADVDARPRPVANFKGGRSKGAVGHRVHGDAPGEPRFCRRGDMVGYVVIHVGERGVLAHVWTHGGLVIGADAVAALRKAEREGARRIRARIIWHQRRAA